MSKWRIWEKSKEEWDNGLIAFNDYNVYQSYNWGEVKCRQGWKVLRLFLEKDGKCIAMVQIQVKQFPLGIGLLWIPGGPVGELKNYDKHFLADIRSILKIRILFLRMNVMRRFVESDKSTLLSYGWRYAYKPILSGASVLIDTISAQKMWLSEIKGKHRYYVKKALSEDVNWVYGKDLNLLEDLNKMVLEMIKKKGLNIPPVPVSLFNSILQQNIRLLIGYVNAKPVSGCLVLIVGTKVNYLTAATIDEGRELNAAYAMIYHLREKMVIESITDFDFGGINPSAESAKGVDHFKLGFGNRLDYLGELEFCCPSIIRYPVNFLLKSKFS